MNEYVRMIQTLSLLTLHYNLDQAFDNFLVALIQPVWLPNSISEIFEKFSSRDRSKTELIDFYNKKHFSEYHLPPSVATILALESPVT